MHKINKENRMIKSTALESKVYKLGTVCFKEYKPCKIYMRDFYIEEGIEEIHECPQHIKEIFNNMINICPIKNGLAYLTVDAREVKKGKTHRRGGIHVDGNFIFSWGGGWLTGTKGRILTKEDHKKQYCSKTGGMLIASSHSLCNGYVGEFYDDPLQGGNCSHINIKNFDKVNLEQNTIYLGNSTFIHEPTIAEENIERTLIRITLPHDVNI